ncbi:MAG: hypothetical protein AAFU61_17970, partial [Pseudomonadota bacterium]
MPPPRRRRTDFDRRRSSRTMAATPGTATSAPLGGGGADGGADRQVRRKHFRKFMHVTDLLNDATKWLRRAWDVFHVAQDTVGTARVA